ncbi:MAG: hypothetical protein AAFO07_23830, partial [Bacteroidota bacterium]
HNSKGVVPPSSQAGAVGSDWKKLDVLVNSPSAIDTLEGEIGGQSFITRLAFFITGDDAQQREFADCLAANNGCIIFRAYAKSGNILIIGDADHGMYLEQLEGGTGTVPGDRVGHAYTGYVNTGHPAKIIPEDFAPEREEVLDLDGISIDYSDGVISY